MELKENLIEQVQPEKNLLSQYLQIAFVVAAYWTISIVTVFVNKLLLSSDLIDLDAPLFITWFQCIVSVFICVSLGYLSELFPKYMKFPKITNPYSKEIVKKVLPLSILFTAMIATNNLCLKYVGVAFYYIGRSLTTVFNVIFTFLILGQKTSYKCIACCGVIVTGFLLGVDQENVAGSLSILGTFFGVLGSLSLSLYSIHTKKVLPLVGNDIWLLSYYNNAYSVIIFLPLMIFGGEVEVLCNYDKFLYPVFWSTLIIGGVCGFAIGYVTALQIKVTSPLTHNVSGTAKACAQTVLATYWFNEHKPTLWWMSNFVVLGASGAYARIRQLELSRNFQEEKRLNKV